MQSKMETQEPPKIPDLLLVKDRTHVYVPRIFKDWAEHLMEPNQRNWVFWADVIRRGLVSKAEDQNLTEASEVSASKAS